MNFDLDEKLEDVKYFLKTLPDKIKSLFNGKGGSSNILETIEENKNIITLLFFIGLFYGMFLIYGKYQEFKTGTLNNLVIGYNIDVLQDAKITIEKESKAGKYEEYLNNLEITEQADFKKSDLLCFIDQFDQSRGINLNYVNRPYKLSNLIFDENNYSYKLDLQGLKYQDDLKLLVLSSRLGRRILDIQNLNINLVEEPLNLGSASYYNVSIDGNVLIFELDELEDLNL